MSYFASVAGLQVVGGSLMIPLVGAWTADLYLATDQPISGAVSVVLGNLTLQGFVYRSDPYGGQVKARLVAGAGGWRQSVDRQGYGSGSGVKLSHVLGDVASACGERVHVAKDQTIGPAYARATAVASDVLWELVAAGIIPAWYVDTSGTTQVSAWPPSKVATPFTVTDQKPEEGFVTVATEDYASWLPGATFSAPQLAETYTCAGVNFVFDNEGTFRLEVLTGSTDRFIGALDAIIARKVAPTRFFGRYEYTISNPSTTTVDGSPVDDAIGLPDLTSVPIAADSISTYTPLAGSICHVMFLNGVATRPVCVWTGALASYSPAAKLGDTVQSMISGGIQVLSGALTLTFPSAPVPNVPIAVVVTPPSAVVALGLSPITGTITTGSSEVSMAT